LIDIDKILKSKDDSSASRTEAAIKEVLNIEEETDLCQQNVNMMSDRREEKRREENKRRENKRRLWFVSFAHTHTQSAGAHVSEGKSPNQNQKWIDLEKYRKGNKPCPDEKEKIPPKRKKSWSGDVMCLVVAKILSCFQNLLALNRIPYFLVFLLKNIIFVGILLYL
jgi:hypothetical protein